MRLLRYASTAGLLLALLAASAFRTSAYAESKATATPFMRAYDKAHETTFNGTISEVVNRPAAGSLIGVHMLVASGGATHDVHLGSYLSKDVTEKVLRSNQPVQVIGMNTTVHGKQVVLARQLITGGRLITVRNEHGFLVHQSNGSKTRTRHNNRNPRGGRQ